MPCIRDVPEVRLYDYKVDAINGAELYYALKRKGVTKANINTYSMIFVETGRHRVWFLTPIEYKKWCKGRIYSIDKKLYSSGWRRNI